MKIYTLTHTDVKQDFSPLKVQTFLSHESAAREMERQFNELHPDIKTKSYGTHGFLFDYNANQTVFGDCYTGIDYCQDEENYWEIFASELESDFLIECRIVEDFHKHYPNLDSSFDETILKLIEEYKRKYTFDFSSNVESIISEMIGTILYDKASEKVGVVNLSSDIICDFFNTEEFLALFSFINNESKETHWVRIMLLLCDEDSPTIAKVKDCIKRTFDTKEETKKVQGKVVCSKCGSQNIMLKYWYNPNTMESFGWDEADECYCKDCGEMTEWKEI